MFWEMQRARADRCWFTMGPIGRRPPGPPSLYSVCCAHSAKTFLTDGTQHTTHRASRWNGHRPTHRASGAPDPPLGKNQFQIWNYQAQAAENPLYYDVNNAAAHLFFAGRARFAPRTKNSWDSAHQQQNARIHTTQTAVCAATASVTNFGNNFCLICRHENIFAK